MNYICETDFKFSELAYASLHKQIDVAMQNTEMLNGRISLSNPSCFTCNAAQTLLWKYSITNTEISSRFPTFNYIHFRLLTKIKSSDQYKLTDIISEQYQKNALLMNTGPGLVSINFYELTGIKNYSSTLNSTEIIYSKELIPNIFYLINQSIPHSYITTENSIKIFSASTGITCRSQRTRALVF